VEVFALVEGEDEPLVAREVRHDAHLDLRVIGREQRLKLRTAAVSSSTECRPNLPADGRLHRDGLQVRIVRRDAPGAGSRLVVGRVDAAILREPTLERLDDLLELRGVAVLEEQVEERMWRL